jgi:di/tricarboxylate transporter
MVALTALGVVPLLTAALVAAFALLATGCLTVHEARQSIDLPVLVMIGAAFGLSRALESTGLAALLASGVLTATQGLGVMAALGLIYLLTSVLTELLTNAAAAALVVPTALDVAAAMNADPLPFALVVAVAASAGFATPFGYQTNLMVMSVGGYRVGDYVRAGLPLNLIVMGVALLAVWLVWL